MTDSYIVIHSWMCTELNLSGNNLLVFALIHGFSQDGESRFSGSRRYIAQTLNISLPTVDKCLKSLVELQLIEQHRTEKNGQIFNEYNSLHGVKKLYTPCKETLHNNIDNTIDKEVITSNDVITTGQEFLGSISKKRPKESLYTKCKSMIVTKSDNKEIQNLLFEWLDMLLEKYKSTDRQLYANVFKGKLNMLDKYDKKDWKEIIEYNLQKGYEGFYPIKNYYNSSVTNRIEHSDVAHVEQMTEQDYDNLKKLVEERNRNGLRTSF